jgi:hypothetical protein
MIVRLYFNAKEEWPLIWSVDYGDTSTERKVSEVRVDSVVGMTMFDREIPKDQPRAWIEYPNAAFTIRAGVAIIHRGPQD